MVNLSNSCDKIFYTYIGNIKTIKKIAEYPISEKYNKEVDQIFNRLAKSKSTIKIGEISKIPSHKATYYLVVNQNEYFFLIIVDNSLLENNAHILIENLKDKKFETMLNSDEELNFMGMEALKSIVNNYQNENSKINDIQLELTEVKLEVRKGINTAIKNVDDVRVLEEKSNQIAEGAVAFNENSEELKNATRKRTIIITIIVVVVVVVLVVVIATPVAISVKASADAANALMASTMGMNTGN